MKNQSCFRDYDPDQLMLFPTDIKPQVLLNWPVLTFLRLRGYHPLRHSFPGNFDLDMRSLPATPHLFAIACKDSVCPEPLSIAFNNGISIDFFSSAY